MKPNDLPPILTTQVSMNINQNGTTVIFGNQDPNGKDVLWHSSVFFPGTSVMALRDMITNLVADHQKNASKIVQPN